ncbi:MAG: LamG domain-containing protein, partial [Ignavibacteriae bacterium]|nr:LamG domain-containing protein [Ignavibacteriota bacterium]
MSNTCLEFNGTNQYAQIPSSVSINSILSNGTFTLEGWYKILGYTSGYFSFLDKQSSWYCEYSRNDTAWTFVEPGDTTAKAKLPIAFDTWYHIAITYNAPTGIVKFYSNGQLIGTTNQTFIFAANTNPLYIGYGISGSPEYGKGRYDEIRIWNVARTDIEISANYNKSLTGNESGLVLYYKFNEG